MFIILIHIPGNSTALIKHNWVLIWFYAVVHGLSDFKPLLGDIEGVVRPFTNGVLYWMVSVSLIRPFPH